MAAVLTVRMALVGTGWTHFSPC